jgi:hypothetical protein
MTERPGEGTEKPADKTGKSGPSKRRRRSSSSRWSGRYYGGAKLSLADKRGVMIGSLISLLVALIAAVLLVLSP